VRFGDFLKTTVLLSAGSATALATVTLLALSRDFDPVVTYVSAGWWLIAAYLGLRLGRGNDASPPIARLLADARHQTMLPELRPGTTLLNRLWPLLIMTVGAGALGTFEPQVASVATGFGIVWALAWRRQHMAVLAIEQRDSARFYVDNTSPLQPIKLVRTPGFGGQFAPTPT
jgi:hypothetical protein